MQVCSWNDIEEPVFKVVLKEYGDNGEDIVLFHFDQKGIVGVLTTYIYENVAIEVECINGCSELAVEALEYAKIEASHSLMEPLKKFEFLSLVRV